MCVSVRVCACLCVSVRVCACLCETDNFNQLKDLRSKTEQHMKTIFYLFPDSMSPVTNPSFVTNTVICLYSVDVMIPGNQ